MAEKHTYEFVKMHGLGNDFIIFDGRQRAINFTAQQIKDLSDRKIGIGCDQLILMSAASNNSADFKMTIWNADGQKVSTCGNATRCVGRLYFDETNKKHCVIESDAGELDIEDTGDGQIAADMGAVKLDWRDIPLSKPCDIKQLPITMGDLNAPVAVNVGNPHLIFFTDNIDAVPVEEYGIQLETNELFPENTNVEFAHVIDSKTIRLRVWERGVGVTQACGSGACATLVAAHLLGHTGRHTKIIMDGGELEVEWLKDNHILMTGPATYVFKGKI
jgi:diaminopimelate epimerase